MKICMIEGCDSTDLATRSARCRVHHREYTRAHYAANKDYYKKKAMKRNAEQIAKHREIILAHLAENPCVDCGQSDREVLQFDHRDREDKVTEIGNLLTGSTQRLLVEIAKCDIRCANCHIKRTRRQMGWWHDAVIEAEPMIAKVEMA